MRPGQNGLKAVFLALSPPATLSATFVPFKYQGLRFSISSHCWDCPPQSKRHTGGCYGFCARLLNVADAFVVCVNRNPHQPSLDSAGRIMARGMEQDGFSRIPVQRQELEYNRFLTASKACYFCKLNTRTLHLSWCSQRWFETNILSRFIKPAAGVSHCLKASQSPAPDAAIFVLRCAK